MAGFGPEGEPPRDALPQSQGNRPEPIEPQQGRPADSPLAPLTHEQQSQSEWSHEEMVAIIRREMAEYVERIQPSDLTLWSG